MICKKLQYSSKIIIFHSTASFLLASKNCDHLVLWGKLKKVDIELNGVSCDSIPHVLKSKFLNTDFPENILTLKLTFLCCV